MIMAMYTRQQVIYGMKEGGKEESKGDANHIRAEEDGYCRRPTAIMAEDERYLDTSARKMSKRMQEPTAVDVWLEGKGYFRKHTPRDPTCLFRAVSEQVYHTQYYHIKVRTQCVNFMKREKHLFEESITSFDHYLGQMECITEWGTMNEIRALSLLYKRDVIIFNGQKQTVENVANNGFDNNLLLCYTPPKQYETVYTKYYIQTAAYCQSLVYEVLYKDVFNMPNIMTTAHKMLHDRNTTFRHDRFFQKGNLDIREQLTLDLYNKIENEPNMDEIQFDSKGLPPIPYKVAKALNPETYRNTDFDMWYEIRREVKYAGWNRHNSNELQIGGKCLINSCELFDPNGSNNLAKSTSGNNAKNGQKSKQENLYSGYIQEMGASEDPVLVFIEELGEKCLVPYTALKPVPPLKKNKHNNPTHNKRNTYTDTGRRWRKMYNSSSRKRKDTITNTASNNINRSSVNNNNVDKIDFETDGRNTESPKSDQHHPSENCSVEDCSNYEINGTDNNSSATIMPDKSQSSVKTNNSIMRELCEEYKKPNTLFTKHNNVDNLPNKPTRFGVSNNHDGLQNSYSKPKILDENYPSHIGNPQINMGVNPNLLFYVFPDGSSYPVLPFLPENFGDFDQMDHLIPSRFFYNLGLEYFRVNQTWNYGTMAFGPNHQGAQAFEGTPPNTNMNNGSYMQEEVARIVNGMQNCSLAYNEAAGCNSDGKTTGAEADFPKTSFTNISNTNNMKQLRQTSSKNFNGKDSFRHPSERSRHNGISKGNKGNKSRHQYNTREQLAYTQHWNQYGVANPSTSANAHDSRIITHMQQQSQQHLDPIMQQQQQAPVIPANSTSVCAPYAPLPTNVFPTVPFYPNETMAETCCNPYYLANGGFMPVTCFPPPLPPSAHHDTSENVMTVPPSYPPHTEAYPPSYPPNTMCPIIFSPSQMQFPPVLQQQQQQQPLPPPPPLPSNVQEHWYSILGQPSHYVQYAGPSASMITEPSCGGQISGST